MAQPSSHHRGERSERSSHHRSSSGSSRTISSTTLLLVLSLILAVLAVMLSLPSNQNSVTPPVAPHQATASPEPGSDSGMWGYLTPQRSKILAQRERDVAQREAEVARREAELLVGAPGGVVQQPPSCPICPAVPIFEPGPPPPVQTIIKEVVKEQDLTPPGWWDTQQMRSNEMFDRELKMGEREREVGRREDAVNRREHDASRRETWIMEQLVNIGAADAGQTVEEEYIYEQSPPPPVMKRRPAKVEYEYDYDYEEIAPPPPPPGPMVVTEVATEYATHTVTHTQRHTYSPSPVKQSGGQPANTRRAAVPTPVAISATSGSYIPRTTAVDIIVEEPAPLPSAIVEETYEEEVELPARRVRNPERNVRPPQRWWGQ